MLNSHKIGEFYDGFGARQDKQFYESTPLSMLVAHSEFADAKSVFEFGCGTGKFAMLLLDKYLNAECRYFAVDVSSTMIELCQNRLQPLFPAHCFVWRAFGSTGGEKAVLNRGARRVFVCHAGVALARRGFPSRQSPCRLSVGWKTRCG